MSIELTGDKGQTAGLSPPGLNKLLPPPSGSRRILCAVSGGPDSMALLHYLHTNSAMLGLTAAAAHYHHGLRPEADGDLALCEDYCRAHGISFQYERGDVAKTAASRRAGIEETARLMRYQFLRRAAKELGCDKIATAHHADDNLETLLLHFLRGTGLDGLRGIRAETEDLWRPFLRISRAALLDYVREHGVPHRHDSSNNDTSYRRNALRHEIIPRLTAYNGNLTEAAARLAQTAAEDADYLDELAREAYGRLRDGTRPRALSAAGLAALPRPVAARVIRLLCAEAGFVPERTHTESVLALAGCQNPHAEAHLPGGRTARRAYEALILDSPGCRDGPWNLEIMEISGEKGETTIKIGGCFTKTPEFVNNSFNSFLVGFDTIQGVLKVRSRQAGDTLKLPGRKGTKTLAKWFQERKLSLGERDGVPVIADDGGVVAVAGLGVHERCAAAAGKRTLLLRVFRDGDGPEAEIQAVKTAGKGDGKMELEKGLVKILITEEQLAARVRELAAEIDRDYKGKELILISVLKGSVVFMADLMRAVKTRCTIDFMAVSSYGKGSTSSGAVRILKDLDLPVENRHVLIVEDILDSGLTLSYIMNLMVAAKPASIRLITLLDKPERRRVPVTPNYCGFTIPDEFVVGYGLDYAEKWRNLPYIAVANPED